MDFELVRFHGLCDGKRMVGKTVFFSDLCGNVVFSTKISVRVTYLVNIIGVSRVDCRMKVLYYVFFHGKSMVKVLAQHLDFSSKKLKTSQKTSKNYNI